MQQTANQQQLVQASSNLASMILALCSIQLHIIDQTEDNKKLVSDYHKLHCYLVALTEFIQDSKIIVDRCDKNVAHLAVALLDEFKQSIDLAYQLIRSTILPSHLINGDAKLLNKFTIDPYNWYCLVKYQIFPEKNSEVIFKILERSFDITKSLQASKDDISLLIALCDKHPINPYLNFTIARWCLFKDNQNPQAYERLVIAQDANHPQADYYLGNVYRFGVFGKKPDRDQALQHFKTSAEQHDHYQSNYRVAKYYQDTNDKENMTAYAQRAVELCPFSQETKDSVSTHFGL